MIHSDSDIQLGTSGSFKRFEPVDKDVGVTMELTTSFNGDWPSLEMRENHLNSFTAAAAAPPEVRLVDNVTGPLQEHSRSDHYKISNFETSICPIPRPKSSINVADLLPRANSEPLSIHAVVRKPISFQSTLLSENSCEEADEEVIPETIQKAVSCETICSDTSVGLDDLEDVNITGNLCVGFEFDAEYCELIVNILEAKDLKLPSHVSSEVETYVKVFCEQDNDACVQTKTYRSAGSPCYKERFLFPLNPREQQQKTLSFQVFGAGELGHYLIGEGEIRLSDVSLRQPITTWITLTDTGQIETHFGELMFSLSYLPTAERLTVVVVKARKLKFQNEVGDSFVKVYLLQHGKKIHKKKTSIKKTEMSPIFNEAMMFSVPLHSLQGIQLRLTVSETLKAESGTKTLSIGHVIVGAQATGRSLSHWNQMLIALRKPIAMWHPLRK
ncbi:synaptotagmin-12-like isoform X2 [Onthophagus taurus]|uniref:synaptotagmin-12-like isoform X2 n=1 Tax=Onthophagus taurus TaxID=166361 RepID=UPI000C20AAB7|nr:synaptotagmin-12-like isoform X2 [Onthophagus taurus]